MEKEDRKIQLQIDRFKGKLCFYFIYLAMTHPRSYIYKNINAVYNEKKMYNGALLICEIFKIT